MEKDENFKVEKFNSQTYQLWKMQMEDYIYQKDIFLSLGGKAKQTMSMKKKNGRFLTVTHWERYGCAWKFRSRGNL
jgi:hypothetical protein